MTSNWFCDCLDISADSVVWQHTRKKNEDGLLIDDTSSAGVACFVLSLTSLNRSVEIHLVARLNRALGLPDTRQRTLSRAA